MMTDDTKDTMLAPLDELIAILPKIEQAKERARLGTALQKATISAEQFKWVPSRLEGLSTLLEGIATHKGELRTDIEPALNAIINLARLLTGEASIEVLDDINQRGMARLPLHIDKVEDRIEALWKQSIQQDLGGQAALGKILSAIPGVESLGQDLANLAARTRALEDSKIPANDRVAERNTLMTEASALADRLLKAGIAPPIAEFLVAVTTGPVRLSNLTEDIFAWIRDHEALEQFSVSVQGT